MPLTPQFSGFHEIIGKCGAHDAPKGNERYGTPGQPGAIPGAVLLPLTKGLFALVDHEDFARASAFKWNGKSKSAQPGRFYAQRTVRLTPGRNGKRSTVSLHRFIVGAGPGDVVDHINGDTLDNRKANLRITDRRGNATNVTLSKNQKRGGFKGVSWHPGANKWQASIGAGPVKSDGRRRRIYLGLFVDQADAARAYDAAAREHYAEFAALNFQGGSRA